ncbi:MAG TPA: V-type ATP synthase subunit C [Anaerovoracaceae bacterium]|nr:V-type ATP synthase subunit C [Anaerovoracaceae bacterium]
MIKYNNADYKYASTVIRGNHKRLLSKEKVEKMLDSKTPEDAIKVLHELNYADGAEIFIDEYDKLLKQEQISAFNMIKSVVPDERYLAVYSYPTDYHNAKTLLKAELLNIDANELLLENGAVETEVLKDAIHNRNLHKVRIDLANAIQKALDTFATSQDPQSIDLIMDRAAFADVQFVVSQFENEFIKNYVAFLIDVANIKAFVRVKEMNKAWDFFSKIFIPGGKIQEKIFTNGYEEPYEQFAEKLEVYGISKILTEGMAMLKESGRFTDMEKMSDNMVLRYVQDGKYIAFGIENVIGYLVAKEMGIKNARIILAGKLAGLSEDKIRERMRDTYV